MLPASVAADLKTFLNKIAEEPFDTKDIGITGNFETVLSGLRFNYDIELNKNDAIN
jgi:hypothetical protein